MFAMIMDLGLFHALDEGAGSFGSRLPHAIQISPVQAPEFTNGLYQRPARFQPQGRGNSGVPGGRAWLGGSRPDGEDAGRPGIGEEKVSREGEVDQEGES